MRSDLNVDLRIGRRLESRRRSESNIYTRINMIGLIELCFLYFVNAIEYSSVTAIFRFTVVINSSPWIKQDVQKIVFFVSLISIEMNSYQIQDTKSRNQYINRSAMGSSYLLFKLDIGSIVYHYSKLWPVKQLMSI